MIGLNGSINNLINSFGGLKPRGGKNAEAPEAPKEAEVPEEKEKKGGANQGLKQQVAELQESVSAKTAAAAEKKNAGEQPAADQNESGVAAPVSEEENAVSRSFADMLSELQNGFTNQLLEALGLGSLNEGGKGVDFGGMGAVGISAQYSLNIAATMSVMNADGSMSQSTFNFSLEASFDYLGIASGKGSGANSLASLFGGPQDAEAAEGTGNSLFDKLREMFSPEATAQRILDFSLSFYGRSSMFKEAGGDTDDARASFADYIGAAIQKGFDQAMGILGKGITDQTASEIDKTHELVFGGLDDFVNRREVNTRKGSDAAAASNANDNKDALYGNLQYFASSLSVSYSSTSTYYSADEVRQLRGNAGNPYANAVQSQDTNSVGVAKSQADDNLNMTV